MTDYLVLQLADERARVYREGSIGYDVWEPGVVGGWVLNPAKPSEAFEAIALAARAVYLCALNNLPAPKYLPRD